MVRYRTSVRKIQLHGTDGAQHKDNGTLGGIEVESADIAGCPGSDSKLRRTTDLLEIVLSYSTVVSNRRIVGVSSCGQ